MEKYISLMLLALFALSLAACGPHNQSVSAEVEFWGLDASVVEIDTEGSILYVKGNGPDAEEILGERCALDCARALENGRVFFVKYDSDEDIRVLALSGLLVGDKVIVSMVESEVENAKQNGSAVVTQVQLGTQRLD